MPISPYAEQLRTADLRVTRPRVTVLEVVETNPHADTDTILGLVRSVLPEVSRQTVYDVLNALTAARLVRRISGRGQPSPRCVPQLRRDRRRGLRGGRDAVSHRIGLRRFHDRRGRGHLLGLLRTVFGCSRAAGSSRSVPSPVSNTAEFVTTDHSPIVTPWKEARV
jgi:hypothetical protein